MKAILVAVVIAALASVASAGACSRVGGYLREADGTFCKECVLQDGFYRNRLGQFCIGSCEVVSAPGAAIVRKDSVTGEVCEPCLKDAAKRFFRTKDGKFCKQECMRDGWNALTKQPQFRDTVTGQFCAPANDPVKAKPTIAQAKARAANRFRSLDPQNPATAPATRPAGVNAGACTMYGNALRDDKGKFCFSECILKDGFYRNKLGEFCIRPCSENRSMTGGTCETCHVDPKDKTVFRTKSGKFCEEPCLRDGWQRGGVPQFRNPITGRFCKP